MPPLTVVAWCLLLSPASSVTLAVGKPNAEVQGQKTSEQDNSLQHRCLRRVFLDESADVAECDIGDSIANALGYLIGLGSLSLYTPILFRVVNQEDASGLTVSTWWLKLASYLCAIVYGLSNGYPLSTYVEKMIITFQVLLVLWAVSFFQERLNPCFFAGLLFFASAFTWILFTSPPVVIASAQFLSTLLNTVALLPQIKRNYDFSGSGGFSPITATLAVGGCAIRLFTIVQLAGSDPLLLFDFSTALTLNAVLLLQCIWYGHVKGDLSIIGLLMSDFRAKEETAEGNETNQDKLPEEQ